MPYLLAPHRVRRTRNPLGLPMKCAAIYGITLRISLPI
jgi:hypothetical protein